MAIGISPTVDFAFKLMLGSPEHSGVTIHFLNAILNDQPKITHVEILNPFLGKDGGECLPCVASGTLGVFFAER